MNQRNFYKEEFVDLCRRLYTEEDDEERLRTGCREEREIG